MVEQSNPARRRERWTIERQTRFLTELAATANVSASARAAGMSEACVYRLRQRSPEFREAWSLALREGYEKLELMLLDRALNGVEKPVWYGGKQVGSITEYSDRLALTLIAAHRASVRGGSAECVEEPGAVRQRFAAKLGEMNIRMGGEG
jgi:hypothetical protein